MPEPPANRGSTARAISLILRPSVCMPVCLSVSPSHRVPRPAPSHRQAQYAPVPRLRISKASPEREPTQNTSPGKRQAANKDFQILTPRDVLPCRTPPRPTRPAPPRSDHPVWEMRENSSRRDSKRLTSFNYEQYIGNKETPHRFCERMCSL